jgi:hypothetical protein
MVRSKGRRGCRIHDVRGIIGSDIDMISLRYLFNDEKRIMRIRFQIILFPFFSTKNGGLSTPVFP